MSTPFVSAAEKLRNEYRTLPNLLATIAQMANFVFAPVEQQVWEKTADDITDDVMSAKFDLNMNQQVKHAYAEVLNAQGKQKTLCAKINAIPILLDFCYVYACHIHDTSAPFFCMPATIIKHNMVVRALRIESVDLLRALQDVIVDELISDLRAAPPYLLRVDCDCDVMVDLLANIRVKCLALVTALADNKK